MSRLSDPQPDSRMSVYRSKTPGRSTWHIAWVGNPHPVYETFNDWESALRTALEVVQDDHRAALEIEPCS